MVEKMRIGIALQPVATALFANSPFRDGSDTGWYPPAKFNGVSFLHTWHLGSSVNPDRPTYLPSNLGAVRSSWRQPSAETSMFGLPSTENGMFALLQAT